MPRVKRPTQKVSLALINKNTAITASQTNLNALDGTTALVVAATAKNFRWDITMMQTTGTGNTETTREYALSINVLPVGVTQETLDLSGDAGDTIVTNEQYQIAYTYFSLPSNTTVADSSASSYRWKGHTTVARKLRPGDTVQVTVARSAITGGTSQTTCTIGMQYFMLY